MCVNLSCVALCREKDTLWQANMRLEAAAGGNRTWMDNSSAQKCLGCSVSFSLRRRRHHCRTCGRIFCTGCSDNWIMTTASRCCPQALLRVCISYLSSYQLLKYLKERGHGRRVVFCFYLYTLSLHDSVL